MRRERGEIPSSRTSMIAICAGAGSWASRFDDVCASRSIWEREVAERRGSVATV